MNYFVHNEKKIIIKISCLIISGLTLFPTLICGQQYSKESIDSLEMLLGTPSISDNELFLVYKDLSDAYVFTDTEKSLQYAWMGVQIAEEKNNTFQIADFYYYIGNIFYYANQTDSALCYFDKSLDILNYTKKNDRKNMDSLQIVVFWSIGIINANQGKYDLALDKYIKALELAEKNNVLNQMPLIYDYLANTYFALSNNQQAEAYYLKAEKLSLELNDSINIVKALMGLCNIYMKKADLPTALEYGEKSLRLLSALPDVQEDMLMSVNQLLTDVWLRIPDYNKAMEYAQKTVEYARQTNIPLFLSSALYTLSQCYLKQEKYKESEAIAFEALATDSSVLHINSFLYGNIAIANIWLKNTEKGIAYFEKYTDALRAYSNQNFQSSLSEMEVKYATEKKEAQIAALEKEKRLMIALAITGGGILLLLLITLVFLWRWTVQKRRIAEQQIRIVATQAVLDGEVQERSRLARDLHDGLGGKLTCLKLGLQELKQKHGFDADRAKPLMAVMDILDESVQEMRRVSHNLMPDTLRNEGLKPAVNDFCRSMSPKIVFNYYGDESRIDLKIEALIYRSIHELVNNALKYADASRIMVQIIKEADSIVFTVQDNGCGFDTTAKTDGIGLQGIRTRVASFGGDIHIDSKVGEGTEVNVELRVEHLPLPLQKSGNGKLKM